MRRSTLLLTGFMSAVFLASCAGDQTASTPNIGGPGEETTVSPTLEDPVSSISTNAAGIEVDALLRGQQSHHIINGKFAETLEELELPVSTDKFDFELITLDAQNHAVVAKPKTEDLVAYAGGIHVGEGLVQSEAMITCAADSGSDIMPPVWTDGQWSCGEGSKPAK